jgi:hypothetical protein
MIALLALALSTSSNAAEPGRMYFGGALGYSYMGLEGQGQENGGGGYNDNSVGFSVAVGSHVMPWIGWEASFLRFGNTTAPGVQAVSSESLNGVVCEAVFYLPAQSVELFLKAGGGAQFGTVHAPQQYSPNPSYHHDNVGGLAGAAGIGVQYTFHQEGRSGWAVRMQYDALFAQGPATLASLGLIYAF